MHTAVGSPGSQQGAPVPVQGAERLLHNTLDGSFAALALEALKLRAVERVAQRREGEAGQNDLPILESIQGSRNDEIGDLAHSFLEMNKDMEQYETDLKMVSAAKQAIETELNVASRIQMIQGSSIAPEVIVP